MYVYKSSTLFLGDTLKSKDIFGVMLGVIFSTDQSTTSHPNLEVLKSKLSLKKFVWVNLSILKWFSMPGKIFFQSFDYEST